MPISSAERRSPSWPWPEPRLTYANGAVAEYLLQKQAFDVVILDLGLPLVDGLTVLKRARAAQCLTPVLVLTALDGLDDRVAGLNAGADDYLTKPFDFPELEARLHALMRRGRPPARAAASVGQLSFDRAARRASVRGAALELSPREYSLLECLLRHEGQMGVGLALPDAATHGCPPGARPLYRLWNRNLGGAPNHRYTTSALTFDEMIGQGWIFEGEKETRVFACVPN